MKGYLAFDAVIALPVNSGGPLEKQYRGNMNMYMENGFVEIEKQDQVSLMNLEF